VPVFEDANRFSALDEDEKPTNADLWRQFEATASIIEDDPTASPPAAPASAPVSAAPQLSLAPQPSMLQPAPGGAAHPSLGSTWEDLAASGGHV